jgi:hypothetical protein
MTHLGQRMIKGMQLPDRKLTMCHLFPVERKGYAYLQKWV